MRNIFAFLIPVILGLSSFGLSAESFPEPKDTIILVHGLGRTAKSMNALKHNLEKAGYHVVARSYPSTKQTIQKHALWLDGVIQEVSNTSSGKIHLVTHSLGGIITRYLFAETKPESLGRVVMLSPPNSGSEIADFLGDSKLFKRVVGPSGQAIGTDDKSIPNRLGPVNFEVGIITGDASLNPFFSLLIPGDDDGKVSVESAKVQGMRDFLVVHKSHTFIMDSPEIAEQIIHFIQNGRFIHSENNVP